MKQFSKILLGMLIIGSTFTSCNRPEANKEGVLMEDYGRNGIESFKTVTGAQGPLGPGSQLYEVPMWEQKGDVDKVKVLTKDGSVFTVDPKYSYTPMRLHGPNIVLEYKNYNVNDDTFFDQVEENILNIRIVNAYKEEARTYKTADSLMNNLTSYENVVEGRLQKEFKTKHFTLGPLTSGLEPPASMTRSIEERNVAIQEANKVRNQLETARMLQEKATIDAQTNRIKAAGLDPKILQQQWIEAIRNSENRIIITDGKTPVILN